MKKYLSVADKLSYALKRKRAFEIIIYFDRENKFVPELSFTNGKNSFYKDGRIVIGVDGIKAKSDDELYYQLKHMVCVQLQHMKSTTRKDFEAGQKLCLRSFCNKISSDFLKKRVRLVKDADYEHFFEELEQNGIYLSVHSIKEIITFIATVVEEGRVERIYTESHPAFINIRRLARSIQYDNMPLFEKGVTPIEYDKLNPAEKLKILQLQVKTLASREKVQKGFLTNYIETNLYDTVKEYIPHVSLALMSKTCKDCMKYVQDILLLMYPAIIEAASFKGAIEQGIKEMLEQMANNPSMGDMPASPSDEEQGSGEVPESLFNDSELEVTLDDDVFDALVENSTGGDDKDGVKVKRKNEKPAPPPKSPSQQNNSDNSDGDEENSEGNSEGSSEGNTEENTSSNSDSDSNSSSSDNGETKEDSNEEGNSSSSKGKNSERNEEGNEEGNTSGEKEGTAGEKGEENSPSAGGKDHRNGIEETEERDSSAANGYEDDKCEDSGLTEEERIKELLRESAESEEDAIDRANGFAEQEEQFQKKMEHFKNLKPAEFSSESITIKYPYPVKFEEEERAFIPDYSLPFELESKGTLLKRKIEEILMNKQLPDDRGLTSGTLDGTLLHHLISSDLHVFKKKGEYKETEVAGYLLLDNSGSMGNGPRSNRAHASNALAVIEEGFKEIMPLKIVAFDSNGNQSVRHQVIKEFDEVGVCNFSYNFGRKGHSGGYNKDGYSIRVATKQLMERPEEEKILIVASDGMPTAYDGEPYGSMDVKAAVQDARRKGIRVVGMYMFSDADDDSFIDYSDMYERDYLFTNVENIEEELSKLLKKFFKEL